MKKNSNWNILFTVISILGGIFVVAPLLLRIPLMQDAFSWFLQPLKDSGYKSSYIETFGAILGTFLAVAGTLWTQRKIDEAADQKAVKESALIIYYDFEFAFKDLVKLMRLYMNTSQIISNVLLDYRAFAKWRKRCRIYIDEDWIHNVARISHELSSQEVQKIYKLYGDLCTIRNAFNGAAEDISEDDAQIAYSIMFHNLCQIEAGITSPFRPTVDLKEDIKQLMDHLKAIAQISV